MLYGYKTLVKNRETQALEISSLVVAADLTDEYETWIALTTLQYDHPNWTDYYISTLQDQLMTEPFKGYKHPVIAFFHENDQHRDEFFAEHNIEQIKPFNAVPYHMDMLAAQPPEPVQEIDPNAPVVRKEATGQTIEEMFGLDVYDPWDRRTEAEKAADQEEKKKYKKAMEEGGMSGESFGPGVQEEAAKNKKKRKKSSIGVTDVKVSQDADGNMQIDGALAQKIGGRIDKAQKALNDAAKAAKRKIIFSPEDFARVLRGDGSEDALGVKRDDGKRQHETVALPKLSRKAEAARKAYQKQKQAAEEEQARLDAEAAKNEGV